ncbi:hypothetical protein WQE_10274 [Paraburkholderia hospita]|jgi:hypothetical protein|uniref:Uncharacterized protein n=1 Tax=Paraburkholderia hospita TaxID=169430 RepID=A0ABP2PUM7_9BURK|nr:hypothetical protein WQE_10274 [Paraburkholderia hospita]
MVAEVWQPPLQDQRQFAIWPTMRMMTDPAAVSANFDLWPDRLRAAPLLQPARRAAQQLQKFDAC